MQTVASNSFSWRTALMQERIDIAFVQHASTVVLPWSKWRPTSSHRTSQRAIPRSRNIGSVSMQANVSRRYFLHTLASSCGLTAASALLFADESLAIRDPFFVSREDLISRMAQQAPKKPESHVLEKDIFYPVYFAGSWNTESKLVSVTCPAGYKLFGRPGAFESAQRDLNHRVNYASRFIRLGDRVVSDRPFNVKSIAEATMGSKTVLDCRQQYSNSPNMMTTTIRPDGASGGVFVVSLKAVFRQVQEGPLPKGMVEGFHADGEPLFAEMGEEGKGYYTSEMVRQEVRLDGGDLRAMPLVKEVETTTLFVTRPREVDRIVAWQKTSSYLTRSDWKYVDAKGMPVDVRWYQLTYTRAVPKMEDKPAGDEDGGGER